MYMYMYMYMAIYTCMYMYCTCIVLYIALLTLGTLAHEQQHRTVCMSGANPLAEGIPLRGAH